MKTIKMIDANGNEVVKPLVDEKEYRKRLMQEANFLGCLPELKMIFDKYDKMLRICKNKQESEAIATMGILEISKLLDSKNVGAGGSVIVNNKTLIKG